MNRTLPRSALAAATIALAALSVVPLPTRAQDMGGMKGMDMSMKGGWRMPPMDPNMPMLPGLGGTVPPVAAFLPGSGIDPSTLPMARPSEVVKMADGDTLDIDVSMVHRRIAGHDLVMFGYNEQYPGPLIEAPKGATIVVRVKNAIQMPTTIHWHGIRIDNRFDGVPGVTQDPIAPGESFTYQVHVPDAGMFWYHPHVREDVQQNMGLFGDLLVTSPDPDYYGPANQEQVLVLSDVLMDSKGLIPYGKDAPTHALMGRFGNVMLVNGSTDYHLSVARGEVVRFYLTNTANSRTFNVTFGGAKVKILASDISRYEHEQWVQSVVIAPAERYIVDVRFDRPGQVAIANTIQAINHFRGEFYPHTDTLGLVTVSDEPVENDLRESFTTLREYPAVKADIERFRPYFDKAPDKELVTTVAVQGLPIPIVQAMDMDTLYHPPVEWNDPMPMMNWLSTAKQVKWILRDVATGKEDSDIHWVFHVGDVVKIRIFNDPKSFHPMNHPLHMHGQRFLVISRDGVPQENLVWKDTAIIPVGSTVDFLVDITNPGTWMFHCHIAEHLHSGMMFNFVVEPKS
jgi:FtsP/CotA-like multicopper oxidase with cupredoxin domain